MDTSLDNANNPFANSNGADNAIIGQKSEGLLLNLSDNFKRNGSDLSPGGDFFHNNSEKSNGKRLASEFDDDEDDLGPETDVDAVDDVLSPSIAAAKALADGIVNNNPDGSFNPFVEKREVEKAALEVDLDLQKQQSSEFDGQRSPREETPTPPADAVHDGGLEENLGDSGEESEDEWNYIKGEEANKENISPTQPDCEVADLLEDAENMSQLNPNAAEFVPVSPTRSIPSPACRLLNDPVIAQSPKRPSEIDISLPDPRDFEKEVKSRPSDVDAFSNGHDRESDQKSPTRELMENLLNGKNIDEIPEFHPGTTPTKQAPADEFHFGPNAAPFTPVKSLDQSETALSTRAVCGDESSANLDFTLEEAADAADFTLKHKEDDPMSMSFYADKSSGDADPFDLNKVQLLPENLEEFLGKPEEHSVAREDAVSDLPEPAKDLLADEVILNNDERIQTTDLDKVDDEKELASPVSNDDDSSGVCELSKSPQPPIEDPVCQLPDVCLRPESQSPQITRESPGLEIVSPEPEAASPEPLAPAALSPEPQPLSPSPEPEACLLGSRPEPLLTPEPETQLTPEPGLIESSSPEPVAFKTLSPEPAVIASSSPEPEEDVCQLTQSPVLKSASPEVGVCELPKSQDLELVPTPEPEPLIEVESTPVVESVCNLESVNKELSVESPMEDVTSSVKDVSSPIVSPVPDQVAFDQFSFAQEINNAGQTTVTIENSSPIRDEVLLETCPLLPPKSMADTETVATTDVNSFLERSSLVDLTSPLLSLGDAPINANDSLYKCEYPLPTEIETENIVPEFAEPVVLSSKDDTPSVPSQEETVKEEPQVVKPEETVVPVAVAATAAVAAVAAAATTEKKTPKTKAAPATKKPLTKTTTTTKPSTTPTKARATPPVPKAKLPAAAKTTPTPRPAVPKAAAPAAKPRTPTATKTIADKKPLANGDVKTTARAALTKKPETAKVAPPKPATTANRIGPARAAAPRPTTAPAKTLTKTTTTTAATTAAPKPRTSTLANKVPASGTAARTVSSTTATSARLSSARTTTSTTTSTTASKTTASPKPRTTTAPTKPRVPAAKTTTKTSTDTEKQNKDSANKLTASRTVTSTRTTATTGARTSTTRKTETKVSGTTARTTTVTRTNMGPVGKKPQEIIRSANKITKTTKIEKPIQNGVTQVVTEQITIVNNAVSDSETQLLKDISPIDNKLLVETNAAD